MTEAAPLLARKREEHRAAFKRKLSNSHSTFGGAHLANVVKKLVETRHLLHASEARASKAEHQIRILLEAAETAVITPDLKSTDASDLEGMCPAARAPAGSTGNHAAAKCVLLPIVSRDNSEAFDLRAKVEELKIREDQASTRAAAAMAKCDELKLVVTANTRLHEEEISQLRRIIEKLRSAGERQPALAACEDARLVEQQAVAHQPRPDFVQCDNAEVTASTLISVRAHSTPRSSPLKPPVYLLQARECRVVETAEKAIEVARDSSTFAELNCLRCSFAAIVCRDAASQARCEDAEAKYDALQRVIPSLRQDEKVQEDDVTLRAELSSRVALEHPSTSNEVGNLSDTVVALSAICTALQAERAEPLVPNGQDSILIDANQVKELEEKLSVSETKVKILEAHLSTVDKHLAALAQGKQYPHYSQDFFVECAPLSGDIAADTLEFDTYEAEPKEPVLNGLRGSTFKSPHIMTPGETMAPTVETAPPVEVPADRGNDITALQQEIEYVAPGHTCSLQQKDALRRLAHAALEGAGVANHEISEKLKLKDVAIKDLKERVSALEREIAESHATASSVQEAYRRDFSKASERSVIIESQLVQARETCEMMAEEFTLRSIRQVESASQYRRDVDGQAAALSAQLTGAISESVNLSANNVVVDAQVSNLEDVVLKCTCTIESLKKSLSSELERSEKLASDLQNMAKGKEELEREVESARKRADIFASRIDVAEARAEIALEKVKSANVRVDAAEERAKAANERCSSWEDQAAAAIKAQEAAERERDLMTQQRAAALSSAQSEVATAEMACAKMRSDLELSRLDFAQRSNEVADAAHDIREAANAVSDALRADLHRERALMIEDRDIIIDAAREQSALYMQRALDYEAAAAKAYAECATAKLALSCEKCDSEEHESRHRRMLEQMQAPANGYNDNNPGCNAMRGASSGSYRYPTTSTDVELLKSATSQTSSWDPAYRKNITKNAAVSTESVKSAIDKGVQYSDVFLTEQTSRMTTMRSIGTLSALPVTHHKASQACDRDDKLCRVSPSACFTVESGAMDHASIAMDQASTQKQVDSRHGVDFGAFSTGRSPAVISESNLQNRLSVSPEERPKAEENDGQSAALAYALSVARPTYPGNKIANSVATRGDKFERDLASPLASVHLVKIARLTLNTIALSCAMRRMERRQRRFALAAWKHYHDGHSSRAALASTRIRLARSLLRRLAERQCKVALGRWYQVLTVTANVRFTEHRPRQNPMPSSRAKSSCREIPRTGLEAIDRVAAMAAGISAAAKVARGNLADMPTRAGLVDSISHGPILFRRSVDASGGVIGIDGKEVSRSSVAFIFDSFFGRLTQPSLPIGALHFNLGIANTKTKQVS